jgi:hypothetical protein
LTFELFHGLRLKEMNRGSRRSWWQSLPLSFVSAAADQAWFVAVLVFTLAGPASAQDPPPPPPHQHMAMSSDGWQLMQDGVVFLTFNHQGGSRGGDELDSQNWWMGMAQRSTGSGTLRFNLMLSLEPATLGEDGYRELFQSGETFNSRPLVDRQHPHDFLMQAAVVWRTPLPRGFALTLAGAPVGEPALGPVAYMHRASAFENPTAPLTHHLLDSTHIAMGVLTAAVEKGKFEVESSVFHGAEPDEQRWDLMDPGPLDSWSVRGWYRPTEKWAFQVSHGFLTNPEASDPGDLRRTTASASWLSHRANGWTAATVAYGRNNEIGHDFSGALAEATHVFGAHTIYGRFEARQVELDLLRFGIHGFQGDRTSHVPDGVGGVGTILATTIGGARAIAKPKQWDLAAGADVTFYGKPDVLDPIYGTNPVSFHVFLRLRPPAPMGRMTDMFMTKQMH